MKWMIIFRGDWADEITCQQFVVVNDYSTAVRYVEEILNRDESYIGSNQYITKEELSEENFEIAPLFNEDVIEFIELWFNNQFGVGVL